MIVLISLKTDNICEIIFNLSQSPIYLTSNSCRLALRAGNQAARKAMVVAVAATNKKSVAINLTGK